MTLITIPAEFGHDLTKRLNGIERVVVAQKWERAAIVYAFTEPQTNKGHGQRPGVTPPKLNIRDFAGQGFLGLSTPKAVSRYREAWLTAITNGWAGPVSPGQTVELPSKPFPPWPYGADSTWEDASTRGGRGPNRPFTERALTSLASAATSLRQLAAMEFSSDALDLENRAKLVESLRLVRDRADEALRAVEKVPVG